MASRVQSCLVVLTAVLCMYTVCIDACSCALEHPQVTFCQDHFALKVKILASELYYKETDENYPENNATDPENASILEPTTAAPVATKRRYSVLLLKVFKGSPVHNMVENTTFNHIYTALTESTCGVNLTVGTRYLLTGYLTQTGVPHTGVCHGVMEWDTLTAHQRKAYNFKYAKGCDCEVVPCFRPKCQKKATNDLCMWNFRADPNSCYIQHALCRRNDQGECSWRKPDDFNTCMGRRSSSQVRDQIP